jgi:hypothetical protein
MKQRSIADAVKIVLPIGADAAAFEREVERIAGNTPSELKHRQQRYLRLAQLCADVIQALPGLPLILDKDALCEQLCQQQDDFKASADLIGRHRRRWRFWRHFELLALAKNEGLDLGYISRSEKKKGEHHWPEPHGKGITYLQTMAAAIGAPVSAHQARDILQAYVRMNIGAKFGAAGKLRSDSILIKGGSLRV